MTMAEKSWPLCARSIWRAVAVMTMIVGLLPASSIANEIEERGQMRDEIAIAWYKGDVTGLENMSHRLRSQNARSPSGVWRMAQFYEALQAIIVAGNWRTVESEHDDKVLKEWRAAHPQSPTPIIAQAMLLRWWSKNAQWAVAPNRPPLSGWQPEIEYLREARKLLEDTKSVAALDPHWYAIMVQILSEQKEAATEIILLHQEAMAAKPLYDATHATAINALLERWPLDRDRLEVFANTVRLSVGSPHGDAAYARMYINLYQARFEPSTFHQSGVHYSRLKAGMEQIITAYPVAWNINHFAVFACLNGDHPWLGKLLAKIKAAPIREVWKHPKVFDACKRMVSG
jgi:hypothetical protein